MKHLNFLSNLLSLSLGSPCTDVSLDRRLTVGSPSGLDAKWMLKLVSVLALIFTLGVGNAWGAVVSGTTYETKSSMPSGWSKNGDYQSSNYLKLISSSNYIQTDNFCQNGITSIVVKARTFGSPTTDQATITIEWVPKSGSTITLGTVAPTTTTLTNKTLSSFSNTPTANTEGSIKISCKGASSSKGSGVSEVTITYTSGSCVSYTITAATNNASYGTVSLTGTTITASPKSGYRVSSSTPYTVTSGTATVTQTGNTFSVTPSSNCTVRINFEAKGCEDKGASSITSTSGGNSYTYGPVDAYYKFSTRQILYTRSDLGLSSSTKKGTIKSIYFKYKHTAAMTSKTSVNIYMANTHLTSLSTSSYVPYSEFTLVYSGSLNCTTTNDWNEFFLDTPFEYNGVGNLVVMIDDNSNAYDGSSFTFYYHAATGAQIYTCSDSDNENPATTDWSGYTATSNRPTTKFCIQEADMVQSTVTWVAGSNPSFGSQTDYEGTALSNPGTPSAASYCPGGKVFVGWTETPIVGEGSAPADLFTSVSGKSIPVGGTTYYAVFATSGSSSKTYQFDITPSQFNTTSYDANNNQKSNTATATDASGATMTVYWTSNQIMKNSSDMQWQKNNGYIYNSTDLGTVNSVTITKSAGGYSTWYGTTEHPTSGGSQGSGKGFFTVKENNTATGKSTQVRVNFTKTITTYSAYATSCCTALASINGSFFWTPLFEPLSLDNSWLKTHMKQVPYFLGPISYPAPPYIYYVYIP